MNDKKDQARRLQSIPNPSELMRARHPDLYSDTRVDEALRLPQAVFEYHLETLTSRKQEYEFEHFCRKLAEKEICPNLRVQTGPTGGGDSKVDTETYPVASEISERWWIGEPSAASERWAFAFSAKKAWKPKLRADIDSVLLTGRDYRRIYFFTNQFVSDKERSKLEDELFEHAGVPVHIIDRTWIVKKVYDNDHLDLAISTLGIEGAGSEVLRRPGPLDAARLAELEELDKQVTDSTRYQGARFQLVEDCLRSAILARGLERPRNEVESRFAQAERLAQQVDFRPQRMRVAYNRAWTSHWWYEDYPAFNRFYDEVEQHLEGSIEASEVERLLNLWQLLIPAVAVGRISAQEAQVEPRRKRLAAMLQAIADHPARLNNALQARTSLALMKATQAFQDGSADQLDEVWTELSQIVDESSKLGTYPVERLAGLVQELGQHVDSAAFDALYEKIVDAMRQRRSEGEAGKAYNERGMQKLLHDKPFEAIKWFGRAEELLVKEEFRGELVMALAGSSYAYERAGLLWAARNKILVAVERSFSVFAQSGEMIRPTLLALQRLVWVELQLGRIPHVLQAMSLASFAAAHLKLSAERRGAYSDEVQMQEAVLGIHLLNISFEVLPAAARMPDVLERLGLTNARLALLFSLGHEKCIYDEQYFPVDESLDKLQGLFERWQDQLAAKDLPQHPMLVDAPTSVLRSVILGSEFVVDTPSDPTSFGVAESLLGALEAFLATSNEEDLVPHRERITISIRASDKVVGMPKIRFADNDGARADIVYPVDLTFPIAEDAHNFLTWLRDSVGALAAHQFMIRDVQGWMEKVAGEERAFSRALMLGDILTVGRNLFGDKANVRLADWLKPEDKIYERLRTRPWRAAKISEPAVAGRNEPATFGSGPPPAELLDRSRLKHTERRIMSPIDIALWDQAKWRGTLFGEVESAPPFLGILFEDGKTGESIFRLWRERWGNEDVGDALRVAIITGLSTRNPAHYAVAIGPNLNELKDSDIKAFVIVSRINRMEPTSSVNLDRFLAAYRRFGAYLLVPATMGSPPTFTRQIFLAKRHLHVRQAWEIGENDPDASVLADHDDPIIPSTVQDPPVKKALERMRMARQHSRPRR